MNTWAFLHVRHTELFLNETKEELREEQKDKEIDDVEEGLTP